MTQEELKRIITVIDDLIIPRKIGGNDESWAIVGSPIDPNAESLIRERLRPGDYDFEVKSFGNEIWLRIEDKERILLRIPKIPPLHVLLFFLTILTTLLAGSMMAGGNPIEKPSSLLMGIPFSFTLMLILGTHEFGHYFFARKHRVDATLPYFIPAPTFIGTFGAFIKIKSPIYRKKALLEIGAAGPIFGFLVAIPALFIGLTMSEVVQLTGDMAGIELGDSILVKLFTGLIFPGLSDEQTVMLHPVAFAGWIGLLVTMLNLLPIGQLDGGHIAYAALGKRHEKIAKYAWLGLIPMSYFSLNWLVWGVLILILMRTVSHPPVVDEDIPLDKRSRRIVLICLAIFILCFIPAPFQS